MPGRASHYHFETTWAINAPIAAVWAELNRPDAWPSWWHGVIAVEVLEPGDRAGLGAYRRMTWRSLLPYRLVFNMRTVRLEPPSVIEGRADGELCGVGLWSLTPTATGTRARFDWTVEATKPWMRWFAPLARPLFEWNHAVSMRWGLEGLRRRLKLTSSP
jgi:uncharacterized protein YndB with AHSA1/START domain